jgi:hypothetical protein
MSCLVSGRLFAPLRTTRQKCESSLRILLCFLLVFVLSCCGLYAAEQAGGSVDVSVRTHAASESAPVSSVYIALIARDQPAYRPTVEAVVDGTVKWNDIPPGRYALIAVAPSFDLSFRQVDIVAGKHGQVGIELQPRVWLTGKVVDVSGQPVAGAMVSHPLVAIPALLGRMSDLSRQKALEYLRTTTDDHGSWKLAVSSGRASPILIEAQGYAPSWVTSDPAKSEAAPVVLRKGSSLRVVTNRPAPGFVLTLIPSASIETSIPLEGQKQVWAREATTAAVEWLSLPPGEYDIVGTWPDPRRFSAPVTLGHVTLAGNGRQESHVTLPEPPPLASKYVRIIVPTKTEIGNLRAFMRTSTGAKEVRAASEYALSGRVLYAEADSGPDEVFFTTTGEVILAAQQGHAEQTRPRAPTVDGIIFSKAEGNLNLSVSEGGTLPAHGNAGFQECTDNRTFVLPINVAKSGDVVLPMLVGCRALALRFGSFSPLMLPSTAARGETVWLGRHNLKAGASAEIHVTQQPGGTNVAGAIVTASVERASHGSVAVAQRIAGDDGRLVMEGLPSGEEITFRAEENSTQLSVVVTRTLEAGQRAVIDPLPLPEPASLTVIPRFDGEFKSENPDAEISGVVAEGWEGDKQVQRDVEFKPNQQDAVFRGLKAGTWRILAVVHVGDMTEPLDVETVTLKSGDAKKIEPVVHPLVLSGHIMSHGNGVAISLTFKDPPGPGAITRRVEAKEDGSFHVTLPREGFYTVTARRSLAEPDIQLGPIRFDKSSGDARIALPEGSLSVRVFSGSGASPAADVPLMASLLADVPAQGGFARLERRAKTNSIGEVAFDEMQNGSWLVTARSKDGVVAEKTISVSSERPASLNLNLNDGSLLEGTVVGGMGLPAGMAAVDCIYAGTDNIPRTVRADADSEGNFSIHIALPAPERLQCGVTTLDGAIGTFITAPVSDARFALPSATAPLTLTNWADSANRDRFWLAASDGGLFDLSWAARKLRKFAAPFTIPRVPAGAWSVVEIDSSGAFAILAQGGAGSLPRIAGISLSPGKGQQVSMKNGDTAAQP